MIAAVLCGGKGSRLRRIIGLHQKCAVKVGGRPWIHRVLDQLAIAGAFGVEEIDLLTGFMELEVRAAVASWFSPVAVSATPPVVCVHTRPSGPEAAIQRALATINRPDLLVLNGDTLVEGFALGDFVKHCDAGRRSSTVRGPSVLNPAEIADSGIYYRAPGSCPTVFPTSWPFLDIGSPEGFAEARRRFE